MKLGLDGFGAHKWPSVERTRQFYERALSSEFDLGTIDGVPDEELGPPRFDALLSFYGRRCWEMGAHPDCPVLFAMHGGPVVDREFLRTHLGRLETADVLIVNCTSDLTILGRFFADRAPRLLHLPLPVSTELFRPRDRRECREVLPVEGFDYIVGFVGRLLPQRNLHQFLRMLAELKRRVAPRTIAGVVVGNYWVDYPVLNYAAGEYQTYVGGLLDRLGLKDNVVYFPARLTDEELAACYGAMDVLIHPTNALDENFGYVPLEAMACGTPVVGAAYGGLKDTVVGGETGFLMRTWATRSGIRIDLLRGVEDALRLLQDGPLRARMSEAAAGRAREFFNEEVCGARLRREIRLAVEERRNVGPRAVALAPPRPEFADAGLLPRVERPWEYYRDAVEDYVSGPRPSPSERSRLRLAAPLVAQAGGEYRLDDPAWPATFRLDESDMALADRCREAAAVAELPGGGREDLRRIERFIEDGLLLCSD